MRQYIRHPVDVPIEIRSGRRDSATELHTHDISLGGLAVHSTEAVEPGSLIEVRIPYVQPAFEARARVAWCRPRRGGGGHEVGVSFLDAADVFLDVADLLDHAREQGRELSPEEAAVEWIEKFAAKFPGASNGGLQ